MLPIAIGTYEVLIIVGIVVVLFGAKKIPELARGFGEGITEFKKASKKAAEEDSSEAKQADSSES